MNYTGNIPNHFSKGVDSRTYDIDSSGMVFSPIRNLSRFSQPYQQNLPALAYNPHGEKKMSTLFLKPPQIPILQNSTITQKEMRTTPLIDKWLAIAGLVK